MDLHLKNTIALVTGSSRGTGRTISLTLAKEGADIILAGRDEKRLESVKKEIESIGSKAYVAIGDATKPEEVSKIFEEIVQKIGRLDILVNNAGGLDTYDDFDHLSIDDWHQAYELNCMSMVYFVKESLMYLRKSDNPRIINISSVQARQPGFFLPHYSAAKAAMLNISKYLSSFLAADKILVNTICPSTINGETWKQKVEKKAQELNITFEKAREILDTKEKEKTPIKKMATEEDVANLVAFLSSEKSKFIKGSSINPDGGSIKSIL